MTILHDLEDTLKTAIEEIKAGLAGQDEPYLTFIISAIGRVDGDISLTFSLSKGYGCDEVSVRGGNLPAIVDEYCRRLRFARTHASLCLPNVKQLDDALDDAADAVAQLGLTS